MVRGEGVRKVYIGLPGKGNPNFHGARPVHLNHLSHDEVDPDQLVVKKEFSLSGLRVRVLRFRVLGFGARNRGSR